MGTVPTNSPNRWPEAIEWEVKCTRPRTIIPRTLASTLEEAACSMAVVAVTGPRQSGKTTLCRDTFPDHAYVSLEPIDTRDFAASDPRAFLSQYAGPVILDEVQRVPDLFSYIQEEVDRAPEPGRFILAGSEHLGLSQTISQSSAGRTGREVNLSALGGDAGVSHNTSWIRGWRVTSWESMNRGNSDTIRFEAPCSKAG